MICVECDRPAVNRQWCQKHYDRLRHAGLIERLVRPTLTERLWSKIERTSTGCWEWTGYRDRLGYARIHVGMRNNAPRLVHRVMYELLVEPIPDGLHLDHLCRNPPCCNPAHLEPVTHRENLRRGRWGATTHCPVGHPYAGENLYTRPNGTRVCNTCRREHQMRRYYERRQR